MSRYLIMLTVILSHLVTSCSSDDGGNKSKDDDHNYKTTISPPDWLIGTWRHHLYEAANGQPNWEMGERKVIVSNNNIIVDDLWGNKKYDANEYIKNWKSNPKNEPIEVLESINTNEYQFKVVTIPEIKDNFVATLIGNTFKKIDDNTIDCYEVPGNTYLGRYSRVIDNNNGTATEDNRLIGTWKHNDGSLFQGTSRKLSFQNISSTSRWLDALQNNFIKTGDVYLKDLEKISSNNYKCKVLWSLKTNGKTTEIKFSTSMNIEFSNNGKTIFIKGNNPWDNSYSEAELTKI